MKEYVTIWHKNLCWKILILSSWILLILNIYYIIFEFISTKDIKSTSIIMLIIIFLIYYSLIKNINWIKYNFENQWISIILSKNKKHFIHKNTIDKLEKINKLSLRRWFWLTVNPFTKELYFISSNQNIIKITINDWRKIYISPRIINDEIFNYYNNK